jgi:hypothetical protein
VCDQHQYKYYDEGIKEQLRGGRERSGSDPEPQDCRNNCQDKEDQRPTEQHLPTSGRWFAVNLPLNQLDYD